MKFVVISGSHRDGAESDRVAQYVASLCVGRNISSEVVSLSHNPLPLWDEGVWKGDEKWKAAWGPIASTLRSADAFVVVSPEWAGMVPPGLKNFFLLCSPQEVGHKPALIVSVSSGVGGSYPVAELRMSSYKNNRLVYIPEHVIVRDVNAMLHGDTEASKHDGDTRKRLAYGVDLLLVYAKALAGVRESGVINHKDFPYGL
jgi:NAD(P)H-dependent FMN reductase